MVGLHMVSIVSNISDLDIFQKVYYHSNFFVQVRLMGELGYSLPVLLNFLFFFDLSQKKAYMPWSGVLPWPQ